MLPLAMSEINLKTARSETKHSEKVKVKIVSKTLQTDFYIEKYLKIASKDRFTAQ